MMNPRATKKFKRSAGRPTKEEGASFDEDILRSAASAFIEIGYEGTSMDEIAKRANTSKQTIYARFESKAVLFESFIDWRFRTTVAPTLTAHFDDDVPPDMFLYQFGCELLRNIQNDDSQSILRLVATAGQEFPNLAKTFWRRGPGRGRELLKSYLNSQTKAGKLLVDDLDLVADQFIGLLAGVAQLRNSLGIPARARTNGEIDRYVRRAVGVFLRFYQPPKS